MMLIKTMIPAVLFSLSAFASVQGKVTIKIDSTNAQVTLQGMSVKEGDKVTLIEKTCQGPKVKLCRTDKVGTATVSRVINEKASEITVDGKAPLKEGLLIEKQ
ncbi:MAG: hypothetical protein J7501_01870 [Bdellovibrio sp.]|nr:hypothetical protein [Bdellovibrio sp.]